MAVKPKCDHCGTSFNSEEELNAHSESDHKAMPTPEKERNIASCCELQPSPIHMQRDEEKLSEEEASLEEFKCDCYGDHYGRCGKTFTCKSDLKHHIHEFHNQCLDYYRADPVAPCTWPGCK